MKKSQKYIFLILDYTNETASISSPPGDYWEIKGKWYRRKSYLHSL